MSERLFLLDTSVVLFLVRGNALGQRIDATYGLSLSKTRPLVSVVSHAEVRSLAARKGWGEKKLEALQHALGSLVTVDINHPLVIDAYVAIDVYSQNHPAGARNMGKNDLWIAACAKASDATLLTTDRDYLHLHPDQLSVEWVDPAL